MSEIKMEGFFILTAEGQKESERALLALQHDIHLAFQRKDLKRMCLLIYHQMVTHFAAVILTDVMLEGKDAEERIEGVLRCMKADLITTMRRMRGDDLN